MTPDPTPTEGPRVNLLRGNADADYCGCCGNEISDLSSITAWCERCLPHVDTTGKRPPWENTYEAVHGKPCPFQVGMPDTESGAGVTDKSLRLTDTGSTKGYRTVEPEDVWSCSEPDDNGRVRAVVNVGGVLLLVEGRRVFDV